MSGQRSAELMAAIRAELLPVPDSVALASPFWRAVVRGLFGMPGAKNAFAAPSIRQHCMTALVQRHLPRPPRPVRVIELAAGFSTRGLELARDYPHAQIVEVDRPAVVAAKQARLRRGQVTIPPNLSWCGADLTITPLGELLAHQYADVVVAEGMLMYYPPATITQILAAVARCLTPNGVVIADLIVRAGLRSVVATHGLPARLVMRLVGTFQGIVERPREAQDLFWRAGYADVEQQGLAELAAELGLPATVPDALILVTARLDGGRAALL